MAGKRLLLLSRLRIHAINAITHTMIIASLPYHPPHHPYDDYRKLTVKWQLMCMDTACVELGNWTNKWRSTEAIGETSGEAQKQL